jgi:PIN domain nuclease of toxin-antitoxin system
MTRVLLDTNAWLWMASNDPRLGPMARNLIADLETELVLSAVSAWEISIKWALGKLPLPVPPELFVETTVRDGGLKRLSIDFDHVLGVAKLPPIHHDPFDRLLIAQSFATNVPLLTGDDTISRYGVATIDARR